VVDTNIRRVIARAIDGNGDAPPPSKRDLAAMESLLPAERAASVAFNAGMMELGAIVCTARSPLCDGCPVRDACAWRLAGYPAYDGPRKAVQKRYEGSDRQVRGLVMAELRASHIPLSRAELEGVWPDPAQRERAIAGLIADGLAVEGADGLELP
jgi:A/G-specific adenine glycosylase